MPLSVLAALLGAALLHATWNAIIRQAPDTVTMTVLVATLAGGLAALALPWLPAPAPESWPFLAASAVFQTLYYGLVAATYRVAEMSLAYPLMRGSAPLIVATAGAALFGEALPPAAWAGIGLISAGILGLGGVAWAEAGRGAGLALVTAGVIACYTLIDGAGVRRSGAPVAYTLWVFLLTALPLLAVALVKLRPALRAVGMRDFGLGLLGGAGTLVSYAVALWAMTRVPVAVVAALRETSILFALMLSGLVLHERIGRARLVLGCVIALGAVALQLA
ncbi:EamA family transporter [Segnochrobactraceae bacterium EtOH-i3]